MLISQGEICNSLREVSFNLVPKYGMRFQAVPEGTYLLVPKKFEGIPIKFIPLSLGSTETFSFDFYQRIHM